MSNGKKGQRQNETSKEKKNGKLQNGRERGREKEENTQYKQIEK